jgi:predicted helicase
LATFDHFIASIRLEFGEQGAGKPFEVFCKWFLENDPEWSKTVDKVWLWDDYPNKWQRQDLGTDLVFRDNEGLIWAVQAKCYGEHRTTTKGDMNSFLADTGRKEVDRRLWMQTTNKMEAKADKTLKGQDKPVTVFNLNSFRDAPLEYPTSFADLYEAKVKDKPKPDPHQIKAIEDATTGLRTSDRGQMIMACGTGKTFTTLWIKEALEAHTTLVLLPSLSLLSQTMREWAWAGNTDFDILNVCSDKSVGKKTEDMDPADAPFPVTSEIEEIAEFLKQPKPKVVFCTYQSSDLIAQAQLDGSVPSFDLAVADEAHRCAGKGDAGFATILDGEKIRATKRLFTTATPRYFGKAIKDEAKANDLAVVGMDEEAVFGPVIHKLTFGQAIEQELLTDYQVVIVGVDEPMVREWIENYEIVSTDPDNQTDARTLAAKIGMLKAVKDYDLKRVISFHSRVAGAKQFSDELVDVANLIEPVNRPEGTFLSDYVSGAMKAGDRKQKIDRLKVLEGYDRGILTNARCLAEGVDVPSLDGVAFIDPRGSQVEIIQAVGRAIRKVRGATAQKKGTIVLPVFIEDGDDHEASIEASNFKPVWDVLKALRAHDEVLAETLDQYRANMAKNVPQNRESITDKIAFDLPANVNSDFSAALKTVLVEAASETWKVWTDLLKVYIAENGNADVPARYTTSEGHHLGEWVRECRKNKRRNILNKDRINELEGLGLIWDPLERDWQIGLSHFEKYVDEFSSTNVPANYITEDGYRLGAWVSKRRHRKSSLDEEKIRALNKLGFIWTVRRGKN